MSGLNNIIDSSELWWGFITLGLRSYISNSWHTRKHAAPSSVGASKILQVFKNVCTSADFTTVCRQFHVNVIFRLIGTAVECFRSAWLLPDCIVLCSSLLLCAVAGGIGGTAQIPPVYCSYTCTHSVQVPVNKDFSRFTACFWTWHVSIFCFFLKLSNRFYPGMHGGILPHASSPLDIFCQYFLVLSLCISLLLHHWLLWYSFVAFLSTLSVLFIRA